MTLRTRVALCLFRARKRTNKTRDQLAGILGCHINTIANVECGNVSADRWADAWLQACNASVMVTLGPAPTGLQKAYELRRIRSTLHQHPQTQRGPETKA